MELKVLLWFLWLCAAPGFSTLKFRRLWYESKPRTWDKAREFCKSHYGDLATLETLSDRDELKRTSRASFHAWMGLKKENSEWYWWNGYRSNSIKDVFAEGQPESGHECGKIILKHPKAYADDCEQKHFFFCENRTNYAEFQFVQTTKPWDEALQYCKGLGQQFMDLVQSESFEWSTAATVHRRYPVWVGLRHSGTWTWTDGTPAQHWKGTTVNISINIEEFLSGSGACVTVHSNDIKPEVHDCSEAFPFICARPKLLVLVPELLSWEQGLEVCRNTRHLQKNFHLLSADEGEMQSIPSQIQENTTSKVWVGLRFLGGTWFWSDGAPVSLPSLPLCPHLKGRCGALDLSTGSVQIVECNEKLNALCTEA